MTVKEFETEILKKSLNMVAPDAMLEGQSLVVISSEEGETEQNNGKKLKDLGIVDGSILKVDDFLQNYELTVTINHYEPKAKDDPPYIINADPNELKAKEDAPASEVDGKQNGKNGTSDKKDDDDDDDICFMDESEPAEIDEEEEGSTSKKRKIEESNDDDVVISD